MLPKTAKLATMPIFIYFVTIAYAIFAIFGSSKRDGFVTQSGRIPPRSHLKSHAAVTFWTALLRKT